MKTKNCEKLTGMYKHECDVQLGVDNTDHIVFICNDCENPLEVIEVFSKNVNINPHKPTMDKCTYVYAVCHSCKTLGKRKFYWKSEDGRYCFNRTKCGD